MDFLFDHVIMPALALFSALLVIGVIAGIVWVATTEKIVLLKSQWNCTDHVAVTRAVMVGKLVFPQKQLECSEYRRK